MKKKDIEFYREQEKVIIRNLSDRVDEFVESLNDGIFDEVQTHFEEFYENMHKKYLTEFQKKIFRII